MTAQSALTPCEASLAHDNDASQFSRSTPFCRMIMSHVAASDGEINLALIEICQFERHCDGCDLSLGTNRWPDPLPHPLPPDSSIVARTSPKMSPVVSPE